MFKLSCLIALGVLVGACSTTLRFYPVEGPYSAEVPVPVLIATAKGIEGNNGPLSIQLPDGITCQGEWSSAAGVQQSFGAGSLFSQYGATYVSGYSVTTGGGQNPGRAIAICGDGTRFEIEYVTGAGTANGFGLARDTSGNIYRVLF